MFEYSGKHVIGGDSHEGDKHIGDKIEQKTTVILHQGKNSTPDENKQNDEKETESFAYANTIERPILSSRGCYEKCPKCGARALNEHFFCNNPSCEAYSKNQWGRVFYENMGCCPKCNNGGIRTKWYCTRCKNIWENEIPENIREIVPNVIKESIPFNDDIIQKSYMIKMCQYGNYLVEPENNYTLSENHIMFTEKGTWNGKWKVLDENALNVVIDKYSLVVSKYRDNYTFTGIEYDGMFDKPFRVIFLEKNFFWNQQNSCEKLHDFTEEYFLSRVWMLCANTGHSFLLLPEENGVLITKNIFMGWVREEKWNINKGKLFFEFEKSKYMNNGLKFMAQSNNWKIFFPCKEITEDNQPVKFRFVLFPIASEE